MEENKTFCPVTVKSISSQKIWRETKIGCWNIRRGLIKREKEITTLINQHNLNVLFLVETDTFQITEEKDYIDTAKLWNLLHNDIKSAETLNSAKTKINFFCKTLEI